MVAKVTLNKAGHFAGFLTIFTQFQILTVFILTIVYLSKINNDDKCRLAVMVMTSCPGCDVICYVTHVLSFHCSKSDVNSKVRDKKINL